jgi:glycerophosphoryl diester phosphodiesterase
VRAADDHLVPMRILAHRALLDGPDRELENTLPALASACAEGFDVEFDVNADDEGRLVLTHDARAWSPEREPSEFLAAAAPGQLHALNVKSLETLDDLLAVLDAAGTRDRFFLFDFELLGAPRELLAKVQRRGYRVAHRVSEREPYLEEYAADPSVRTIWLDELDERWVRRHHVRELRAAGKDVVYVSPDLHGERDPDALERRWRALADWGATGICTDYPRKLRDLLGGN